MPSSSSQRSSHNRFRTGMATTIASLAQKVGEVADFVHRSTIPYDEDEEPTPSLLKEAVEDVHDRVVKGKPFSIMDLPAYYDAVKNLNGVGIDDRKMLLEKVLVLMSRLPEDSQFAKNLQEFVIDTLYKDLPHPPANFLPVTASYAASMSEKAKAGHSSHAKSAHSHNAPFDSSSTTVTPAAKHDYSQPRPVPYAYRSNDGSGYNPLYPKLGAAGTPYARTVPPLHPQNPQRLPDPGLVFDTLLKRTPNNDSSLLPATDADGFAKHPGGISSMFFAFADLIIHSCFNTNHREWSVNEASSYLDLSPLYGSSDAENEKVRRIDGTGRMHEDVFADNRILFMPPSVPALLLVFCRNHNFIADKLLAVNEWGTYVSSPSALASLSAEQRRQQDDEIFHRARLVNCGAFMGAILGDYVGAILGLVRDGLSWRLDPLSASRERNHEVSPRGEGNGCSIEFNLLYRWHATLSKEDTKWTEAMFKNVFETEDFSSITIEKFVKGVHSKLRPDPDPRNWTFDGTDGKPLKRDPTTGGFRSGDIAALLQNATEYSASAFKARGIPEVLRVIEIMGIEQSRRWGACTLNEFRKYLGLKPYESFKDWNPDPTIYKAAEALYENIDNLELHVGMQAEEAKLPVPGAGLCPGYTISRAILADAVALTRGDRFLTTDFTVYNLTSWGYQDCFPEKNDGSYGGMLTKLLYRVLPDHYPAGSAYAHFPFMVPSAMRTFLAKLPESPVSKYTYARPGVAPPVEVVESFEAVRDVIKRRDVFESAADRRLWNLTKGVNIDIRLVNETLNLFNGEGKYSGLFAQLTEKLLNEKSVEHAGTQLRTVDIVKDVINLVPVYFIANELTGLPIKTAETPHGVFREKGLYEMFATICHYVFLNNDPYLDWVLREKSHESAQVIVDLVEAHLRRLSGKSVLGRLSDSVVQWYTGEDKTSDAFLTRVLASQNQYDNRELACSVFAAATSTAALYSKAIAHIVNFYLDDSQEEAREEIAKLANDDRLVETDAMLYGFAREALRLDPAVSSTVRKAKREVQLKNGSTLKPGQKVYCSITSANLDVNVFGEESYQPDYARTEYGITGLPEFGITNSAFFKSTVPHVMRAIFKLKNIHRAPGSAGRLSKISETVYGCDEDSYIGVTSKITPWPASLLVQYATNA